MFWISILICLNLYTLLVSSNQNQERSIESSDSWLKLFRTLNAVEEDKSSSSDLTSKLCQDSLKYSMPVLKSGCNPLSSSFPYFDFSSIQKDKNDLCSSNCKNLISMFGKTLQPSCGNNSIVKIQTSVGSFFNLSLALFTKTLTHSRALLCQNCQETLKDNLNYISNQCFDSPLNISLPIPLTALSNNSTNICSESCFSSLNLFKSDVSVACNNAANIDTQIHSNLKLKLNAIGFSNLFEQLRSEICIIKKRRE